MNKTTEMAKRATELMNQGSTLEEAMVQAMTEFQPKKTGTRTVIADRVAWISGLDKVAELRKAVKVAFAKKSKSKGKPDTEAKYQKEIDAGRARLNELIADVESSDKPYIRALELGEDTSGVLQRYLQTIEVGLEDLVKDLTPGLTAAARKELVQGQPTTIPDRVARDLGELDPEFLELYTSRLGRGDQRVITITKRLNLIDSQLVVPGEEIVEMTQIDETQIDETQIDETQVDETQVDEAPVEKKSKKKKAE